MTAKLNWFAARLLFESSAAASADPLLFEERVVLIECDSGIEDAKRKANKYAASLEEKYKGVTGETVRWTFRELLDLVQLNETVIEDGSEVYYHFLTAEEAESLRETLKQGSLR